MPDPLSEICKRDNPPPATTTEMFELPASENTFL